MQNLYENLREGLQFNKFVVGELLFVEYTCPIKDEFIGIWSQSDFLVHVLSGKKSWRTTQGTKTITSGQTVYIKKGAAITKQFFEDDFCMLIFFISDDFIKNTIKEISGKIEIQKTTADSENFIIEVKNDIVLSAYFQSMLSYFHSNVIPENELLILKIKELIINILSSPINHSLASYFKSLPETKKTSLLQIMENNFCYNLSLEDYAKLCSRSLSSFKRDFKKLFGTTPGKWLINKRLDYSKILLDQNELNISQIVFECGFENLSHFSRAFKNKFGLSPINFRKGYPDK